MSITGVTMAAVVVRAVGLLIGVLLGTASEKFKVEVDEREILVHNELSDNNCGGCRCPGCDGLAKAIVEGNADVGACPVGDAPAADKIAAIIGVSAGGSEKKVVSVKCRGTCDRTKVQYNYYGLDDCKRVSVVPGTGEKACIYGYMGYGSCVKTCAFDAIYVVDGVVLADKEKRVACGKCMASCPNGLIELVPYSVEHLVQCSSYDKGKDIKARCEADCIGCTLCIKQCEFDAIHMDNNVVVIDYEKCTDCDKCAAKCPAKVIV